MDSRVVSASRQVLLIREMLRAQDSGLTTSTWTASFAPAAIMFVPPKSFGGDALRGCVGDSICPPRCHTKMAFQYYPAKIFFSAQQALLRADLARDGGAKD